MKGLSYQCGGNIRASFRSLSQYNFPNSAIQFSFHFHNSTFLINSKMLIWNNLIQKFIIHVIVVSKRLGFLYLGSSTCHPSNEMLNNPFTHLLFPSYLLCLKMHDAQEANTYFEFIRSLDFD